MGGRSQPRAEAPGEPEGEARPWSGEDLLRALAPALRGESAEPVAIRETHASWVLLAGGSAYKVKKPVRLPFLDYGTVALRHAACREELRVNRELGGDVYRDPWP